MDTSDKAHVPKRNKLPGFKGDIFKTRMSIGLDPRTRSYYNKLPNINSDFEIVGLNTGKELKDLSDKVTEVFPPITRSDDDRKRAASDTILVVDPEHTRMLLNDTIGSDGGLTNHQHYNQYHRFLQTQGYIPGVDSQFTIRQPFVMENGMKPTVKNAFENMAVDKYTDKSDDLEKSTGRRDSSTNSESNSNDVAEDTSTPEYVISTFPPVGNEEIDKHAKLNKEAEKNSRNKPQAYQDYLRKLQVQKRLLVKPKPSEQKSIKRKNKKLQLKTTKLKDTREDLFAEKPETPPKTKEDVVKPMKVIQSFRYSRAIAEYYKNLLDSRHSFVSFDTDTVNNDDDDDEIKNGWLVKSLGPQVLNLSARTLPSCNPIELRLRRKQARQCALEHAKLSKRSSNLSRASSQRLSRSNDSFIGQSQGHDLIKTFKSTREEVSESKSPFLGQTARGRFLPDIPEVHKKQETSRVLKDGGDSVISNTTKIVLNLPLITPGS